MAQVKISLTQIALFLSIAGLLLALFLLYQGSFAVVTTRVPGCISGSCGDIIRGPYGKIAGIPVSVLGIIYYGAETLLIFWRLQKKNILAAWLQWFGTVMGGVVSTGLILLQLVVIHAWCSWCMLSAFISFALLFIAMVELGKKERVVLLQEIADFKKQLG